MTIHRFLMAVLLLLAAVCAWCGEEYFRDDFEGRGIDGWTSTGNVSIAVVSGGWFRMPCTFNSRDLKKVRIVFETARASIGEIWIDQFESTPAVRCKNAGFEDGMEFWSICGGTVAVSQTVFSEGKNSLYINLPLESTPQAIVERWIDVAPATEYEFSVQMQIADSFQGECRFLVFDDAGRCIMSNYGVPFASNLVAARDRNGRQVVCNPLRETADHGYAMDFEQLESVIDAQCKLLILSNPHNPAGIVWDADTLRRLADICHRHGLWVISDEIHCDLALWGYRHIPFATVSKEAAEISITFGAPTKTFNFAGLVSSFAIVSDDALRQRFYTWLAANEYNEPDIFGPIATMAAFTEAWLPPTPP